MRKGLWLFDRRWGVMANEGGTPLNMTLIWGSRYHGLFFYAYVFGLRFHFCLKRRVE